MTVEVVELLLQAREPLEVLVWRVRPHASLTVRAASDETPRFSARRCATERLLHCKTRAMAFRPEVIARAQADLDAGRPWNAANRLQGYLAHDPLNVEARLMLGQVLLDMGELEVAGRALLPSERDDATAREAIDAWLAELDALDERKIRLIQRQGFTTLARLDALGPIGRARTEPVVQRVRAALDGRGELPAEPTSTLGDRVELGCMTLGCGSVVVVLLAGVWQIADWLVL